MYRVEPVRNVMTACETAIDARLWTVLFVTILSSQAGFTSETCLQGASGAGRNGGGRSSDGAQLMLFVEHVLIMALWPLYVQPILRPLSFLAYRYFLLLAMVSHGYKVSLHNTPLDFMNALRPLHAPTTWVTATLLCCISKGTHAIVPC